MGQTPCPFPLPLPPTNQGKRCKYFVLTGARLCLAVKPLPRLASILGQGAKAVFPVMSERKFAGWREVWKGWDENSLNCGGAAWDSRCLKRQPIKPNEDEVRLRWTQYNAHTWVKVNEPGFRGRRKRFIEG